MPEIAFDRDRLVEAAHEATGLDDLGEPTWSDGLDRLLDDLPRTAHLNDVGIAMVEADVTATLASRLQILEWRRTHPDVATGAITRPIVICGQPRTGTTILHDLFAQDPAHRAPLTWEVDSPVPRRPPSSTTRTRASGGARTRARHGRRADPRLHRLPPDGGVPRPGVRAHHRGDFRSMLFSIQYEVPAYNRWLLHEADLAPAYRWHRVFLQHLQSGVPTDRWLLKSPAHLWHLGALLAEYPDVVVIQTHRDPLKVIASVSALAAHLRRMGSDESSIERAAAQYADDIFVGLDRSMAARSDGTLPADQVIDVQFSDFVADPFTTIGAAYDQLGLDWTPEIEGRMRAFLERHPGDGGGGGSRYTFADTGLDADALRERAREYQDRFGVRSETVV